MLTCIHYLGIIIYEYKFLDKDMHLLAVTSWQLLATSPCRLRSAMWRLLPTY